MNKTLATIAIALAAATAMATDTLPQPFSWSLQAIPNSNGFVVGSVAGFDTTLGTLTGVKVTVTGTKVVATVDLTVTGSNVNPPQLPYTTGMEFKGTHTITIGNISVPVVFDAITPFKQVLSAPIGGPSAHAQFGEVDGLSALLGGPGVTSLSPVGFNGPGTISVFAKLTATYGATDDAGQLIFTQSNLGQSVGLGNVVYTYTPVDNRVPEAETYVAGLALAGLAGYGFYRRNKLA